MSLSNCKALFLDIHGVLYNSSNTGQHEVIKDSIEAIEILKKEKFPFLLVTNESQITVEVLHTKMVNLGFKINKEDIYSPIKAITDVIEKDNLKPFCIIADSLNSTIKNYPIDKCDSVIIADATDHFTYENMNKAFKALMTNPNCRLISAGKGRFYKDKNQGLVLDLGPFTHALEFATGKEAEILGKPSKHLFKVATDKIGFRPDEITMVGDDIINDVSGAQSAGLRGVLVRSGKYSPADEHHEVKPDLIVDTLYEFVAKHIMNR